MGDEVAFDKLEWEGGITARAYTHPLLSPTSQPESFWILKSPIIPQKVLTLSLEVDEC
jgi:hypothetical protein